MPAQRMLGSALLTMHLFIVLFAMLAFFGLRLMSPIPLLIAGGAMAVACVVAMLLMPRAIGYLLGWAVQAATIAAGFIASEMFLVGIIFGVIWGVGMYWGRRIDRERARAAEPRTTSSEGRTDDEE